MYGRKEMTTSGEAILPTAQVEGSKSGALTTKSHFVSLNSDLVNSRVNGV
jgi:hypothetical protein